MEQSMIIQSASFDESEIEVSNILLNLKDLIEERDPPLIWSSKRKRSDRNLDFNSPSSSTNFQVVEEEEEESDNVEIEFKSVELKSSPDTSLTISKKSSSKEKTREELMSDIEKLTQRRELLRREVETVQKYYNSQKAYNLELKAMREKVMINLNGQGSETCHTLQYPMGQLPQVQPMFSSANGLGSVYQYPMGQLPQVQPMFSPSNGLGFVNYTGPVGIFTMNSMSHFEHNRGLAERKAQYAEARRKRMMKRIEVKRSYGSIRPPKR